MDQSINVPLFRPTPIIRFMCSGHTSKYSTCVIQKVYEAVMLNLVSTRVANTVIAAGKKTLD